ncbi:SMC-Scp complex subunit ScpB [Candidatus Woesearchaeota archaeon]|nr:SMC-Scp complex subunit ScpB [Candidatus Woesearchaeota archaeon]
MENDPKKVEAVLFAVGKEITIERIASLCSLTVERTEEIIAGLQQEYNSRDHSLRLVKKESGWKLTVRDEFIPLVSSIVSSTELERPLMETLAVIAWKYPIVQSDVIKLRSASAYDHLKALEEQGYIAKEKTGRTFKIKLTKKFFEYFDLPSEEAKQAFLKFVPPEILNEAEQVNKEADEVERLIELDQNKEEAKEEIKKAMGEINSTLKEKNKEE